MASGRKAPWHERWRLLRVVRRWLRAALFRLVRKFFETDDGRRIMADALKGLLPLRTGLPVGFTCEPPPYHDLGSAVPGGAGHQGRGAIFITARFRSGSTLLWNLFRNVKGFTAYYEPLNERQWFDPAIRGNRLDATHRGVTDYWREYEGLEILGNYYREHWISQNLLMNADFWEPDLKRYVDLLIERAAGRPVLQFNRIDFRLPWFRQHFSQARIVHLFRHPRDQWCSSLLDLGRFPANGRMAEFAAHDGFYLLMWARNLNYHFPFLDEKSVRHPYQLFYYLWKLSYIYGRAFADCSLAYEDLVAAPRDQLAALFSALDVRDYNLDRLVNLVDQPSLGRWKEYASDSWFRDHESACEAVLAEFGLRTEPNSDIAKSGSRKTALIDA
jgi:hypothetical protein